MGETVFHVALTLLVAAIALFLLLRFFHNGGWDCKNVRLRRLLEKTQSEGSAITARETAFLLAGGVLFRIAIYAAALLCSRILTEYGGAPSSLEDLFTRWDGRHYLNLIEKGYAGYTHDGENLYLVFFPLYVWIARLVNLVFHNAALSAMLVSTVCYAWGTWWLYRLAAHEYGPAAARHTVVYLAVFPFSFFFGGIMTESLFFLTTSAALYYLCRHKWLAAGVWGALASMSRMLGLLLVPAGMVELVETYRPFERGIPDRKARLLAILRKSAFVFLPCVGSAVYLALNFYIDGDPFAFSRHQQHWHQGLMWVSRVVRYLFAHTVEMRDPSLVAAIWLPELLLFVLFLWVLILALRAKKIRTMFLFYGFAYLISTYSLSWLMSAGRYLSCGSVFFLFLAVYTKDKPRLRWAVVSACAVFLGVYLFAFIAGGSVM